MRNDILIAAVLILVAGIAVMLAIIADYANAVDSLEDQLVAQNSVSQSLADNCKVTYTYEAVLEDGSKTMVAINVNHAWGVPLDVRTADVMQRGAVVGDSRISIKSLRLISAE